MHGKCPKCEQIVMSIQIDGLDGHVVMGGTFKMLAYKCPSCQSVLGVQMDPIAVMTDTVSRIKDAFGKEG